MHFQKTLASILFGLSLEVVADARAGRFPRQAPFTNSSVTSTPSSTSSRSSTLSSSRTTQTISGDCGSCGLQAHGREYLTYGYIVENVTATVEFVPYVTIYPNSTTTSWSTITQTPVTIPRLNGSLPLGDSFDQLSTELTWEWSGVILTYPTTYVAYRDGLIFGGTPIPTTTAGDLIACDTRIDFDPITLAAPIPASLLVYPSQSVPSSYPYILPTPIVDYLAAQPGVSEQLGGNDPHACTTQYPGRDFLIIPGPVEVRKTSVLKLETATAAPIIRTADVPPQPKAPEPIAAPQPIPRPETGAEQDTSPVTDETVGGVSDTQLVTGGTGTTEGNTGNQPPAGNTGGGTTPDTTPNQPEPAPAPAPAPGVVPAAPGGQTQQTGNDEIANAVLQALGFDVPVANTNPFASPPNTNAEANNGVAPGGSTNPGTGPNPPGTPAAQGNPAAPNTPANPAGPNAPNSPGSDAQPIAPPAVNIGGQIVTANPAGAFVVGGSTASVGGPAITVGGTVLSINTNNAGATVAVVNGVSTPLAPAPGTAPAQAAPVLTLGDQVITANAAGNFVIGTATLSPGGPAVTQGGTVVSLATNAAGNTVAIVNGATVALSTPIATSAPVLTVGGSTFQASSVGSSTFFVVDGTTLTPGQTATVRGSVITVPTPTTNPVITIGGTLVTASTSGSSTFFVVDGTTLTPGETATVRGSTITIPTISATSTSSSRTSSSSRRASTSSSPTATREPNAASRMSIGFGDAASLCLMFGVFAVFRL